jgi:hypothetical protein
VTKPEVDATTQAPKGLHTVFEWMSYGPLQPDAGVQPIGADNSTGETDAVLENDPRFLRVDRDRPKRSGKIHKPIERRPKLFWFSPEMVGQPVLATGMPQVLCNKAVSALRAAPERFRWYLAHGRISVIG